MYSRKSVGPRMEPWGTPALTRYSCEDFPSRTTQSFRNVSCSFLLHIKYEKQRQYLTKESVSSKYRVDSESKKSDVNDVLNWLSIAQNVTPSF